MGRNVIVPTGLAPSNLSLPPGNTARFVDSDLYNICERIKQVSPRLQVVLLEDGRGSHTWAIMENCEDGVLRLVKKYRELDGRVITDMQRLLALPFEQRLEQALEEAEEAERKEREREMEALYERLGRPMWTQLEHDGFIETRPKSYPKIGVAAGGRRAR